MSIDLCCDGHIRAWLADLGTSEQLDYSECSQHAKETPVRKGDSSHSLPKQPTPVVQSTSKSNLYSHYGTDGQGKVQTPDAKEIEQSLVYGNQESPMVGRYSNTPGAQGKNVTQATNMASKAASEDASTVKSAGEDLTYINLRSQPSTLSPILSPSLNRNPEDAQSVKLPRSSTAWSRTTNIYGNNEDSASMMADQLSMARRHNSKSSLLRPGKASAWSRPLQQTSSSTSCYSLSCPSSTYDQLGQLSRTTSEYSNSEPSVLYATPSRHKMTSVTDVRADQIAGKATSGCLPSSSQPALDTKADPIIPKPSRRPSNEKPDPGKGAGCKEVTIRKQRRSSSLIAAMLGRSGSTSQHRHAGKADTLPTRLSEGGSSSPSSNLVSAFCSQATSTTTAPQDNESVYCNASQDHITKPPGQDSNAKPPELVKSIDAKEVEEDTESGLEYSLLPSALAPPEDTDSCYDTYKSLAGSGNASAATSGPISSSGSEHYMAPSSVLNSPVDRAVPPSGVSAKLTSNSASIPPLPDFPLKTTATEAAAAIADDFETYGNSEENQSSTATNFAPLAAPRLCKPRSKSADIVPLPHLPSNAGGVSIADDFETYGNSEDLSLSTTSIATHNVGKPRSNSLLDTVSAVSSAGSQLGFAGKQTRFPDTTGKPTLGNGSVLAGQDPESIAGKTSSQSLETKRFQSKKKSKKQPPPLPRPTDHSQRPPPLTGSDETATPSTPPLPGPVNTALPLPVSKAKQSSEQTPSLPGLAHPAKRPLPSPASTDAAMSSNQPAPPQLPERNDSTKRPLPSHSAGPLKRNPSAHGSSKSATQPPPLPGRGDPAKRPLPSPEQSHNLNQTPPLPAQASATSQPPPLPERGIPSKQSLPSLKQSASQPPLASVLSSVAAQPSPPLPERVHADPTKRPLPLPGAHTNSSNPAPSLPGLETKTKPALPSLPDQGDPAKRPPPSEPTEVSKGSPPCVGPGTSSRSPPLPRRPDPAKRPLPQPGQPLDSVAPKHTRQASAKSEAQPPPLPAKGHLKAVDSSHRLKGLSTTSDQAPALPSRDGTKRPLPVPGSTDLAKRPLPSPEIMDSSKQGPPVLPGKGNQAPPLPERNDPSKRPLPLPGQRNSPAAPSLPQPSTSSLTSMKPSSFSRVPMSGADQCEKVPQPANMADQNLLPRVKKAPSDHQAPPKPGRTNSSMRLAQQTSQENVSPCMSKSGTSQERGPVNEVPLPPRPGKSVPRVPSLPEIPGRAAKSSKKPTPLASSATFNTHSDVTSARFKSSFRGAKKKQPPPLPSETSAKPPLPGEEE